MSKPRLALGGCGDTTGHGDLLDARRGRDSAGERERRPTERPRSGRSLDTRQTSFIGYFLGDEHGAGRTDARARTRLLILRRPSRFQRSTMYIHRNIGFYRLFKKIMYFVLLPAEMATLVRRGSTMPRPAASCVVLVVIVVVGYASLINPPFIRAFHEKLRRHCGR